MRKICGENTLWCITQLSPTVGGERAAASESPLDAVRHRRHAEAVYFKIQGTCSLQMPNLLCFYVLLADRSQ